MFAVVALFYAAPFVFAIADALGRPAGEWKRRRSRTAWLTILTLSIVSSPTLVGQLMCLVYAKAVPETSPEGSERARIARGRAGGGFALSVALLGPLWVATGFSNSDGAMFSSWATCAVVVMVSLFAVLYDRSQGRPGTRVAVVAVTLVTAACAGWFSANAAMDNCSPRCNQMRRNMRWLVPAYSLGGGLAAFLATRPPREVRGWKTGATSGSPTRSSSA